MPSSRKGVTISRKACDLCRRRKTKCPIQEGQASCEKCVAAQVRCTFHDTTKRRGPASRIIRQAQSEHQEPGIVSIIHTHRFRFEDLLSSQAFDLVINVFLDLIYPVIPLVHRPSFLEKLKENRSNPEPEFFRVCISICAFTIGSLPRRFQAVSIDASSVIRRAAQLFTMSRLKSDPVDMDAAISLAFMSMACHYGNLVREGWNLINEGVSICRELKTGEKESYENLTYMDGQIRKRLYWIFFLIAIQDRLTAITPRVVLISDPLTTDWNFLIPDEIHDDSSTADPPIISAFVGLIKVFLSAVRILSKGMVLVDAKPGSSISHLTSVLEEVRSTTEELPAHLQMQEERSPEDSIINRQFDIMRANIHITSLYIQSSLVEHSFTLYEAAPYKETAETEITSRLELWKIRASIAEKLLHCLGLCRQEVLESNGSSLVFKVREMAATLLGREEDRVPMLDTLRYTGSLYVAHFLEILSTLDHAAKHADEVGRTAADGYGFSPTFALSGSGSPP